MIYSILLLLGMTFLGSLASLFLKYASKEESLFKLIKNRNLYMGIFLYLTASLLNILLLRIMDYSTVLPLTSITYLWTMLLSALILKEKIGVRKIAGVLTVFIGALFIFL